MRQDNGVKIKSQKIGTYLPDKNGIYRHESFFQKKKKKPVKKKRHNKTYAGRKTKYVEKQEVVKARLTVIFIIFIWIFSCFTSYTNSIEIKAEGETASGEKKITEVVSQQAEEFIDMPVSVVIVEEEIEKKVKMREYITGYPVDYTVKEQIRQIAEENNFRWVDYLLRLAECENDTFDPWRINSKKNIPYWSIDRGIFMINSYHHSEVPDECAFDVECATLWTMQRINDGYQYEWTCDSKIR